MEREGIAVHELKRAIAQVLNPSIPRGEEDVLVEREELALLPEGEDYTVHVTFIETELLENLRSVYIAVKDKL